MDVKSQRHQRYYEFTDEELIVSAAKNIKRISSDRSYSKMSNQIEHTTPEFWTVDEAYEFTKGSNRFVKYYGLPLCIANQITSIGNIMPDLSLYPIMACSSDGGGTWAEWSVDDAWSNDDTVTHKINDGHIETIHNWVTKLDLVCEPSSVVAMIGASMFLGQCISTFTVMRSGDIYGRKPVVTATNIITILLLIPAFYFENLYALYFVLMWLGIVGAAKGTLLYIYYQELVPKSEKLRFHSIGQTLGYSISLFYFVYFVTVRDGLPLLLMQAVLHIGLQVYVNSLPESPKFLFSKGRIGELNQSLEYIADVNGAEKAIVKPKEPSEHSIDGGDNMNQVESISFWHNFTTNRIYAQNLLIMLVVCGAIGCSFHSIRYYMGFLPGNLHINRLMIIIPNILSMFMTSRYLKFFGSKYGISIAYISFGVISILIILAVDYIAISYILVAIHHRVGQ